MKAFKYLVFLIFFTFSVNSYSASRYFNTANAAKTYSTPQAVCKAWYSSSVFTPITGSINVGKCTIDFAPDSVIYVGKTGTDCPSATKKDLKVPTNAKSYVCVSGCQYRISSCVDVDIEPGMTCSAISTGQDCGTTPPPKPQKPNEPPPPEQATPDPADPNGPPPQNTANSESTSTSSSESTSTQTTNNNTTITNTTTNTTTNTMTNTIINLDRLENVIKNMTSVLSNKLDAILGKMEQDGGSDGGNGDGESTDLTETNAKLDENNSLLSDLKDWLTGEGDGSNGTGGDNPFGNDAVPEKAITPQDLKTNIFGGSASCPADRTLSFQLFTGKSFSKTFSFAMWCDKLAIFGTLILIASYLYGAYIITSKS